MSACRGSVPGAILGKLAGSARHRWPLGEIPFSTSIDSPAIPAEVRTPSFAGVALVDPTTGAIRKEVDRFQDPVDDQTGGAYDGRYAVWKVYLTPDDLAQFVVRLWTRATGRVTTVGVSRPGTASPWQDPVLAGRFAAWVEGRDNRGAGVIVLLDLATGHRRIVHRGHVGWILLARDQLLWAESAKPGALTEPHALDLHSFHEVALPPALRGVRGAWGFAESGGGLAWFGGEPNALYVARSLREPAIRVFRPRMGGFSPPIAAAPGLVAAPISSGGVVLARTSDLRYTIFWGGSFGTALGRSLLLHRELRNRAVKSIGGPLRINATDLSGLRCGSRPASPTPTAGAG